MSAALFKSLVIYPPGRYLLRAATRKRGALHGMGPVRYDGRYFGGYRVRGTVKVAGSPDVPVVRRVLLFNVMSPGFLAKEMWSLPDGSYDFKFVGRGPWFVIARDHTGEYNAVIADNIYGEPM